MQKYPLLKLFLLHLCFILFISLSHCFAGWYDPNWSARRPVIIDNTSNSDTLYEYQVKVNSPYFTGMQNDFDDIRFTIDDGITSIPYWIEEYNPSDYAIVWVKVPLIPALDTTIIYLYYGNPDAVSESDGEAVFDFFDDFNDQDISDWTVVSGHWTAQNRILEQIVYELRRKIRSNYIPDTSFIIDYKKIAEWSSLSKSKLLFCKQKGED